MKKLTVSLIQMDILTAKVEENFDKASKMIEKAASRHSHFIVLPEMWSTGFAYRDFMTISKECFEPTIRFLRTQAVQSKAILVGGSIPEVEGHKIFNTTFVFSPDGKIAGSFRKVHVFSPTGEHEHFAKGDKINAIETDICKIGIANCYDIRFPELVRKLWAQNIKIMFAPAQWPAVRIDHFLTLLKARAIESQVFTAGCNRIGKDKIYEYPGESVIYDPWGEIVEKGGHREEVVTGVIDLKIIAEANEKIPIHKDRRADIYK